MPYPVQSLWIGERLSALEELAIRSFLANGHEFHLYTYGPMEGIPPGTTLCDANGILPADMVFRDQDIGSFTGFSDLFRYKLLLDRGGWWVDMDIICLRQLPDPADFVFTPEYEGSLTNCVLFSRPNAAPFEYLWRTARAKDPATLAWCEIGPPLVQETVARFGLEASIQPVTAFCPVPPSRWFDLFLPGRLEHISPDSLCVHFWHECWRRAKLDKNEEYGPRSLYERLKAKYGVSNRRPPAAASVLHDLKL